MSTVGVIGLKCFFILSFTSIAVFLICLNGYVCLVLALSVITLSGVLIDVKVTCTLSGKICANVNSVVVCVDLHVCVLWYHVYFCYGLCFLIQINNG